MKRAIYVMIQQCGDISPGILADLDKIQLEKCNASGVNL
jgi:hypothetical protein